MEELQRENSLLKTEKEEMNQIIAQLSKSSEGEDDSPVHTGSTFLLHWSISSKVMEVQS